MTGEDVFDEAFNVPVLFDEPKRQPVEEFRVAGQFALEFTLIPIFAKHLN